MSRVFKTAGVIIVIGVFFMAIGQTLYSATSDDFWNKYPYDVTPEGRLLDQYSAVTNVGIMIIGLGLAIIAFGLARQQPSLQFREVPSNIPLDQYPQAPQPPQNP